MKKILLKDLDQQKNIKILFALSMMIIIFYRHSIYEDNQYTTLFNENKFDKIIPRINLNNSGIPNKSEIFSSQELYITNTKLTNNYINLNLLNEVYLIETLKNYLLII